MRIRQRGLVPGALSISPLLAARVALGAFGVWVASIGLRALLRGHPFAANAPVGRWLIGGVLAHDAVIAPTVFVLGAVTVRLAGPRLRQALAAILLIGGSVVIVGLPDVLRKGHNANPTVTPLDYTRNLIIVLLAVVGGVLLTTVASALWRRRRVDEEDSEVQDREVSETEVREPEIREPAVQGSEAPEPELADPEVQEPEPQLSQLQDSETDDAVVPIASTEAETAEE
jgi:hypothetical protein